MIWRLTALLITLSSPLFSAECKDQLYKDNRYSVCEVDIATEELRLFLYDDAGEVHGLFSSINADLARDGIKLELAMNAGMYHEDRSPVGLYIEDGAQAQRIITADGPGNFGLLPNGVFCFGKAYAKVIEARKFAANPPACQYASQSGPMLVIDGALHPRFLLNSSSEYIRNGVGISADGSKAIFAISRDAVTFHDDSSGFGWRPLGPIVGVVTSSE